MGERWDDPDGIQHRHWDRVKQALCTTNCIAPPLYGLPKDHKTASERGHPLRPVCRANESINGPLSDTLSEIILTLGDVADDIGVISRSTEDVLEAVTSYNNNRSWCQRTSSSINGCCRHVSEPQCLRRCEGSERGVPSI